MTTRLVLGCHSFDHVPVDALADDADTLVVTGDESHIETLRSTGVAARSGDCTCASELRRLVAVVDTRPPARVVVAGAGSTGPAAARAAREAFPQASLLAYTGVDGAGDGAAAELSAVADRLIDPTQAVADRVLATAGRGGLQVRKLQRLLRELDSLAVVAHDNPDPDAIASAVALETLAERAGCPSQACYAGDITHQENRALVNLLEFDLRQLDDGTEIESFDGVALVDHSRPGVNDSLPPETSVDVVIDHHPPREPVEARFVDLRSGVGATSTLLVDYFRTLDVDPGMAVATGLLYGIRVDTHEFRREVSPDDLEAAAYLAPEVDHATLERVESPSITADTVETVGRAVRNREVRGTVLTTCVGTIRDRDTLAQAADRLLDMEGITTTLVYGFREGTIYVSARARGADLDVGETLREAFRQIGDAGGHADMAGAQIPMGVLGTLEDGSEADLSEVVRDVVTDRFFETLRSRPNRDVADSYHRPDRDPEVAVPDES
jgi:nanoRNase/pAp phosphatase (c-di-AMP/oligoRNAs hydrolase)